MCFGAHRPYRIALLSLRRRWDPTGAFTCLSLRTQRSSRITWKVSTLLQTSKSSVREVFCGAVPQPAQSSLCTSFTRGRSLHASTGALDPLIKTLSSPHSILRALAADVMVRVIRWRTLSPVKSPQIQLADTTGSCAASTMLSAASLWRPRSQVPPFGRAQRRRTTRRAKNTSSTQVWPRDSTASNAHTRSHLRLPWRSLVTTQSNMLIV